MREGIHSWFINEFRSCYLKTVINFLYRCGKVGWFSGDHTLGTRDACVDECYSPFLYWIRKIKSGLIGDDFLHKITGGTNSYESVRKIQRWSYTEFPIIHQIRKWKIAMNLWMRVLFSIKGMMRMSLCIRRGRSFKVTTSWHMNSSPANMIWWKRK